MKRRKIDEKVMDIPLKDCHIDISMCPVTPPWTASCASRTFVTEVNRIVYYFRCANISLLSWCIGVALCTSLYSGPMVVEVFGGDVKCPLLFSPTVVAARRAARKGQRDGEEKTSMFAVDCSVYRSMSLSF